MMVTGTGTNYTKKHSRSRSSVDKKDKVIIANSDDDIKEYVCPFCNFILHTRKVNGEVTCLHCQTEFTIEGTRRKSKIETPHKNTETLIADPRTLYGGNNPGKNVFTMNPRRKDLSRCYRIKVYELKTIEKSYPNE